jgi:hypothetical protein
MAHGALGKQGEAFKFHSKAGAVPVILADSAGGNGFGIVGQPSFDEAAAISTAEAFVEHLWNGRLAPAKLYLQDAALLVILTLANDGTYENAMTSVEDMEQFIHRSTREMDDAANMDW